MNDKTFAVVMILTIISATYCTWWGFSELRGEEIHASAIGEFGQIEIIATDNIRALDLELDAEHRNITYMTGHNPTNRIIEIKVLKNEGVYREYVDYFTGEINIYDIGNVTIILDSGLEPWGYINYNEIWFGALVWVFLMVFFGLIFEGIATSINRKHYTWKYKRKEAKAKEERRLAKEAKLDKKQKK